MAKADNTKNPDALASVAGNVFSGIVVFFMIVVLTVFPLYYDNYYFNILAAKYQFYYLSLLCMAGLCLIAALVFLFVDKMEYGGSNTKKFFEKLKPGNLKNNLNAVDITLIIFLIFSTISTLHSDYTYESFWGNEGRYSGLFLMLIYGLSVFLIAKLGRIKKWHLDLFLFAGILVCLFGITDYFRMDLLGWKVMVKQGQKDSFTSTIGNINTYTAYVALVMATACGMFAVEKNMFRNIWYFVVVAISFFAIITGQSDNAYLALGALFALLPFALFATRKGIKRYLILAATFFTVIYVIDGINDKMAETVIGLTGIFKVLATYSKLAYIVIGLWIAVVILYIWDYYMSKPIEGNEKKEDRVGTWLRICWLVLVLAAAFLVAAVLYDANFGGNAEKYQSFSQYLIFDDRWGTTRGYCWRIGWESYIKQPMSRKLFGFGPDTFGILTWDYRQESLSRYGVFFESAHNEYLQYLVTIGIFGLISYIAFLAASCIAMVKGLKRQPWAIAPLAAVVCYGAQAFVNINLPIATPLMWTLLAIGLAICRSKNQMDEDKKRGQ